MKDNCREGMFEVSAFSTWCILTLVLTVCQVIIRNTVTQNVVQKFENFYSVVFQKELVFCLSFNVFSVIS